MTTFYDIYYVYLLAIFATSIVMSTCPWTCTANKRSMIVENVSKQLIIAMYWHDHAKVLNHSLALAYCIVSCSIRSQCYMYLDYHKSSFANNPVSSRVICLDQGHRPTILVVSIEMLYNKVQGSILYMRCQAFPDKMYENGKSNFI